MERQYALTYSEIPITADTIPQRFNTMYNINDIKFFYEN